MKCPKCNVDMERGYLAKDNGYWVSAESFSGNIRDTFNFTIEGSRFFAYHCANCGKIELTTTDYDKSN